MLSYSKTGRKLAARRGVSFIEFFGCMAALGGGVVLGSMYLGIDVKTLAVGVLERADLQVPAVLSEAETSFAEEISAEVPLSTETSTSLEEGVATDNENSSSSSAPEEQEPLDSNVEQSSQYDEEEIPLTDEEIKIATEAYWLAFDECIHQEITNRSKSIDDPRNWRLFDYLLHRKAGHQLAVEQLEQLDNHGVDPRLKAHAEHFLTWHRAGESLFNRATHLLTDAPAGKLSGPFAQSWQSSATQHRMEEKLLLNKHKAVASYLEHAHKLSDEPDPAP